METSDPEAPRQDNIRGAVLVSIAGLGLSSVATQLSLLRELLGAFSGNELVLGICLGNWFALTAAGAWIGEAASRLRRRGAKIAVQGHAKARNNADLPAPRDSATVHRSYRVEGMAKDTEKLIRQLSLISYLMAERRPVTALDIKRDVEGYSGMNEDAFARRFYADRSELESLRIPLTVEKPVDGVA